jgi:hypothetical protein
MLKNLKKRCTLQKGTKCWACLLYSPANFSVQAEPPVAAAAAAADNRAPSAPVPAGGAQLVSFCILLA